MPAYVIEFLSGQGPQRRQFTLDNDRPLREQLEQVLAELQRRGIMLRGGAADELAAYWMGRELDGTRAPAALGLTPQRPIELRMQRRRAVVYVPPILEQPPERFTPKGVYAGAAWGLLGGMLAWAMSGLVADRGGLLTSNARLDVLTGALWGTCVATLTALGCARRADRPAARIAGLSLLGAVVVAGGWVALTAGTPMLPRALPPGLTRMAVWGGLSVLVESVLIFTVGTAPRVRLALRALPIALTVGLVAGALSSMPSVPVFWQAMAAVVAGAGVGAALAAAGTRDALAVLELEVRAVGHVGVASLQEWALCEGTNVRVRNAVPNAQPAAVQLVYHAGRCRMVSVDASSPPRELRHEDRFTVGQSRYRFRHRESTSRPWSRPWSAAAAMVGVVAVGLVAVDAQRTRQTSATAAPVDAVALVRCTEKRPLPCLRVRMMPDRGDDGAWSGHLGPYPLMPVLVRAVRGGGPPRAVLALVDASGSMAGEGAQVARAAVRSFLRALDADGDSTTMRAGITTFASRGVAKSIRAVSFGSPNSAAEAVDRLPPPSGNTGLFTAVAEGAARVAAEARSLGPTARATLVVVTDGRNDVRDDAGRPRPGDDAGLLEGAAGRMAATEAAQRVGVTVHFVSVGSASDMEELRALAGDGGLALRTALDAIPLQQALAQVDHTLSPGREVLFVVSGAERASLALPGWPMELVHSTANGTERFSGRWTAPLLIAPMFEGIALRGVLVPEWLRLAADASPVGQRTIVAAFLVVLGACMWWLPGLLWTVSASAGEPGRAAEFTAGASSRLTATLHPQLRSRTLPLRRAPLEASACAAPSGTVRADVREAAPRRPADVTAASVRRPLHEVQHASRSGLR